MMTNLCISIVLMAILPLHECSVTRLDPFDLDYLSEQVQKLTADVNTLINNPHELTTTATINAAEQIKTLSRNLEAMKKAIMNKVDPTEEDLDAQIQVKVQQLMLKQTAEKLKKLTESHKPKRTGKLSDLLKGVGNLIKGAAKTFEKVAKGVKETVGDGVKVVTGVATSVYNSVVKTGSDVYNTLNSAILEDTDE